MLCAVRYRSLRRADRASRGVLPTVMRRCVWSRNLKNEEVMACVGLQRHGGGIHFSPLLVMGDFRYSRVLVSTPKLPFHCRCPNSTNPMEQTPYNGKIFVQIIKKSGPHMKPKGTLPSSQKANTEAYPEPAVFSPHHSNPFISSPVLILSFHFRFRIPK